MIAETVLLTAYFDDLGHDDLREWRRRGWLRPVVAESAVYYEAIDIARIRLIRDLQEAMAVNEHGVEVALGLLDQLHDLRSDLQALLWAVGRQDGEVRQSIAAALAEAPTAAD